MIATWQCWGIRLMARWLCIGLLTLFAGLFAIMPGYAAERWGNLATTVFQNYGRDQGLPHPVPTALVQDHRGFLWIGTQGGLARWDGYRFRAYKANPALQGRLPDDWVETLHVDASGLLWVGGGAGGLARYDDEQDRFIPVPLKPASERTHVGALTNDDAGGLWVGTDDGLHHLTPVSDIPVTSQRAGQDNAIGLPTGTVQALLRDRAGTLWVGTADGLAFTKPGSNHFTPVPLQGEITGVTALFEDEDRRIWIGTARRGLFVKEKAETAPKSVGMDSSILSRRISAICDGGQNEIWASLRGGGIVAINHVTGSTRTIRHDRTLPSSLAHDDVWSMLRDNAGSIWVGSTGGLSHHPQDPGLIKTVFGATQRPDGLSASDILSILPTRDGHIWIGYLDGGVDLIDPMAGRITGLRPDPANPERALPPDIVFAIAEGADGTIYFGTRRGLYAADRAGNNLRRILIPGRDPSAKIAALTFDAGILWIGGEEDGVWGFVPDTHGNSGRLTVGPTNPLNLSNQGIDRILRGSGQDLWVGTRNGLNRVDLATRAVEIIAADPINPTALPARFVSSLLFDRQGRLWVGTFGGGLAVMTGRTSEGTPQFRRLTTQDRLPHNNVDSLEMDAAGTIWVGTDDGLAMVDPTTMIVRPVRRADGAPLVDYFAGGGATSLVGEALFGAKGGFTVARPGTLPAWNFQPPLVVTDLRVGGVPVPVGRFLGKNAGSPLVLSPSTNNLAVEFAALDFTAPERNRYAYRLDGFDRDWIETDASRRLAIYAGLPPGNYTLHLRGSNRDGVWADRDLELSIVVLPDWYQRLGVRLMAVFLLLTSMAGLVLWRTAYLRHRQRELERQIAERTADLRAANDRLAHMAMTDPLTGCANRRHFMERAAEVMALANRHGTPLCLAVLDLDDFKRVNDTHGHPAGDAVLTLVGHTLKSHLRSTDLVGRVGGEEFALLMTHTDLDGAMLLADRLREAIGSASTAFDGDWIGITTSIGVTQRHQNEDFDSLYARADAALYVAKQTGRNRVEIAKQP